MNDPFAVGASLASLLVIANCIRFLKRTGTITFFHIASIALLVTNGIGMAFATDVTFDVEIPPLTDVSLRRASISILLFCASISILARAFYSTSGKLNHLPQRRRLARQAPRSVAIAALSVAILFIVAAAFRFLILNDAIDFLAGAFVRNLGKEHYDIRREFADIYVAAGRGAYLASVAMFIFCPVVISVLVFIWIRAKKSLALVAVLLVWGIQLCLALVFGQRSPLLFCIVQPFATWIFVIYSRRIRVLFGKTALLLGLVFLVLFTIAGSIIYQITDDKDFIRGVAMLYTRVLVVPIQTSGFIYDIFPESVPFRGFYRITNMGNESVMSNDINFADVSEIMTGYRYDANTCLIPVAYSGFGYFGVVAVACIYFFYCWMVDRFVSRQGEDARALAITSSLYTLAAISNVPLFTAAFIYGFGVSAVAAVWLYGLWFLNDWRRENLAAVPRQADILSLKPARSTEGVT